MIPADRTDEIVDVVVVGLGPTGLTLAHLLGQRGLSVLVLERQSEFYGNARAVYTDDECMRIFQSLGLAEELQSKMVTDCPVQFRLPDGSLLLQLLHRKRPYGWSPSNFFYQPYLEQKLAETLAHYPDVRVQRGRELVRFEQDVDGVTAWHVASGNPDHAQATAGGTADGIDAEPKTVRSRFLVACDGGRSTVRSQLGIKMSGQSFPNPWLVVDIAEKVRGSGLRHVPYFTFICDPACPTVCCVQPDGHHRFEFMLMPGETREHMEDPETVRKYLARHVDVDNFEVLRHLVYTFNALIAERWREGRVFLAGDAAHMTPQFIGQGMNAGIRDAYNLAWKLDMALRGWATDDVLDTYQSERYPHVRDMISVAVRMKDFVSMASPTKAFIRNMVARLATGLPWIRDFVREGSFIPEPEYHQGSYFGLARDSRRSAAGRLLPQPTVRSVEGQRHLLDHFLGNDFALIGIGVDPRTTLNADQLAKWQRLGTRCVAIYPFGERPQGNVGRTRPDHLEELEDIEGALLAWLESRGHVRGDVVVLRPDRIVYGVTRPKCLPTLTRDLGLAFNNQGTINA